MAISIRVKYDCFTVWRPCPRRIVALVKCKPPWRLQTSAAGLELRYIDVGLRTPFRERQSLSIRAGADKADVSSSPIGNSSGLAGGFTGVHIGSDLPQIDVEAGERFPPPVDKAPVRKPTK